MEDHGELPIVDFLYQRLPHNLTVTCKKINLAVFNPQIQSFEMFCIGVPVSGSQRIRRNTAKIETEFQAVNVYYHLKEC